MKKKWFVTACTAAVVAMAALFPAETAMAAEAGTQTQETAEVADDAEVEILDKGTAGKEGNIQWKIDADGVLTIEGSGDYVYIDDDGYNRIDNQWVDSKYWEKVTSAVVKVTGITSLKNMFCSYCDSALQKVDLSNLDTSEVSDMSSMFYGCSSLGGRFK